MQKMIKRKKNLTKEKHQRYEALYDLGVIITSLYPNQNTRNPYRLLEHKVELPPDVDREHHKKVYDLLLHAITLLNRTHRMKDRGRWISEREDVIATLALLKNHLMGEYRLNTPCRQLYADLDYLWGREKTFTHREVMLTLRRPLSTLKRQLRTLHYHGLLELVEVDRFRRFHYKVVKLQE